MRNCPESDIAHSFKKARVIRLLPHSLLTACEIANVAVDADGNFDFSQNKGMLKLAVVERHKKTGKFGLGLLHGEYGLKNGAIATSISHDSHNIVAAGDNDEDLRIALEEIEKMGAWNRNDQPRKNFDEAGFAHWGAYEHARTRNRCNSIETSL